MLLRKITMNSVLRSVYKTIFSSLPFGALRMLKLGKLATSVATPVLATELTTLEFFAFTALRTIIGASKLFYHVPTLIGSLYFKAQIQGGTALARLLCFLAPLACMALFVSTPVGSQAWVYSAYWLIPAALALVPHKNLFLTALGSTFMTHAVGSVIFIYLTPMTASYWVALMPVVLFERCLYAAGITALYHVVQYFKQTTQTISARLVNA